MDFSAHSAHYHIHLYKNDFTNLYDTSLSADAYYTDLQMNKKMCPTCTTKWTYELAYSGHYKSKDQYMFINANLDAEADLLVKFGGVGYRIQD